MHQTGAEKACASLPFRYALRARRAHTVEAQNNRFFCRRENGYARTFIFSRFSPLCCSAGVTSPNLHKRLLMMCRRIRKRPRRGEVAEAQTDASKDVSTAAAKVDEKKRDLNNVSATAAYDVAIAKADGNHKTALDKCAALSGDAQTKCKDQADADYEAAKATEVSRTK
jgi:hypothetical protein